MSFEVKKIEDKEIWESLLLKCGEKTFLQSWNWGEFNKMMGNKIWRLGIYASEQRATSNEQLIGVALVVKTTAKRGSFLFLPHGPVIKYEVRSKKYEVFKVFLEEFKKIAQEENISFIRVSPIWEKNEENIEIFRDLGFRPAPIHMHPEETWQLNIAPSEDELLIGMRKTTRYLIKKALKNKDIEVVRSQDIKDVEIFNQLYQATVDRQHFVPFPLDYLKNEFLAFSPDNQILIFLGKYRGEIICAGMFVFWQNIVFYHHGASSLKYPKIPVSYLLQWEAIKEAKKRGCRIFNFWGIAPQEKKSHPWAGLTLFKKGFGGYEKKYVKTQDLPLSKGYCLTFLFEKLRRIKRGL